MTKLRAVNERVTVLEVRAERTSDDRCANASRNCGITRSSIASLLRKDTRGSRASRSGRVFRHGRASRASHDIRR